MKLFGKSESNIGPFRGQYNVAMATIFWWIFALIGGSVTVRSIDIAYMLYTGAVLPGEPIFIDEVAPTMIDALKSIGIGVSILAIGFGIRWLRNRAVRDMERKKCR